MQAGKSINKRNLDGLAGARQNLETSGWQVVVWEGTPDTASVLEGHFKDGKQVALIDEDGNLLVQGRPGKARPWLAGGRRWCSACGAILAAVPLD